MRNSSKRFLSRASLRGAVAAIILSSSSLAWAADPPDLVALSVQGPAQVLVGGKASVNTVVINLGGPYSGTYLIEVVLSADNTVDLSDPIVATKTTMVIGSLTIESNVPESFATGVYNWGMRITSVTGEVETFNNTIIGGQVEVFEVDLQVTGPTAVNATCLVGGPSPAPVPFKVFNGGSADGILIFSVYDFPSVPWLAVSPTTSFAVAGGAAQPVTLSFDSTGLAAGEYTTNVVFQNYQDGDDYVVVPVTLTVGEVVIIPGDTLLGQIDSLGETKEVVFDGLEGMKFKMRVYSETGNVRPKITLWTHAGTLVKSWTFKHSSKVVKKSVKLPETGRYRLVFESDKLTLGSFQVKTGCELPEHAQSFKEKLTPVPGTGTATVSILALANCNVSLKVRPTASFSGETVGVTLTTPSGSAFDFSSQYVSLDNGGLLVNNVTLTDAGEYTLKVTGFGGNKEKVVVTTWIEQQLGKTTVILP